MKLNFKRIASVLTGTVMLTSTVALAAAAANVYPQPYSSNVVDTAVVYGSAAGTANTDIDAAMKIKTALGQVQIASAVTTTGSTVTTTTISGENKALEGTSSKQHLGDALSTAFSRSLTDTDLPTLLAGGSYVDNNNKKHDYTQKVVVNGSLKLTQFSDDSYKRDVPTLAYSIPNQANVLSYSLEFTDYPDFTAAALKNSDLWIMGKKYYVQDFTDGSQPYLTLMDSATTLRIPQGATRDVPLGNKTYSITVSDVTSDKVWISTNGGNTKDLSQGGTYDVGDGTYVGVKNIIYKTKESETSSVELTVGQGQLVIKDGTNVKLNDKTINGLTADIVNASGQLQKIILQWNTDDKAFVTSDTSLTIPGFNSIQLSTKGMQYPYNEDIQVKDDGRYTEALSVPFKDGNATVDFISFDSGKFSQIGRDATNRLVTGDGIGGHAISFNKNTDNAFVATWASGKDSESYYLTVSSITSDNNVNETKLKNKITNTETGYLRAGDTATYDNVNLVVTSIDNANKVIVLTPSSASINFDTIVTPKGLTIQLPVNASTGAGAVNATMDQYNMTITESDKDGNVANGAAFWLKIAPTSSDKYASVENVFNMSGGDSIGGGDTKLFNMYSPLATTLSYDTSTTQKTADITYHGGESYATLYLTTAGSTISSGGSDGSGGSQLGTALSVSDTDAAKNTKNLIVVGGSCVNSVAAKLLFGSEGAQCGTDFSAKTTVAAGQYMIATYQNPYNAGKIATLVAGYNAEDTTKAVNYLLDTTKSVNTSVGASLIQTTQATVGGSA